MQCSSLPVGDNPHGAGTAVRDALARNVTKGSLDATTGPDLDARIERRHDKVRCWLDRARPHVLTDAGDDARGWRRARRGIPATLALVFGLLVTTALRAD